jgi:beta-galactosidase
LADVKISEYKVWVDDNAFPLLSGEVHYWRLAPENWHVVLERAREMGIDVISSYVCWDFHEYAPGVFDFTGETDSRRNLSGFLDLLTEMGFWIVIRPGPYVYTEW